MTLGAGLVLSGCGDDDTATTPAPAPPPPPPPAPEPEPEPEPEPQAPATPTGFHVDTTQTSLTWHWNAVEGAIGYAVQVSTDEMFDDTDTITPTAETSFTVADLPPQTTLYARVAAAAGTLEAPLLSAWTTHVTGTTDMPPPPPPPPMAPATPTGLMAEEGEGSITWMWDAVEGADGYAVQVSMDEMFDDMDETTYTMETMHTVSDLGYGETRFARVASTSGEGEDMLMSMYTTHVTGMSMAEPPPPPPPAPDPVMVTFSLEKGHYLEADDGRNAATAKAYVNKKIMVESNTSAVITPMFVEDANGVGVTAGSGNMPFAFVEWGLLQSAVLDTGATFMIQRTAMGANQEMEPTGDMAYVTCGPFECTESSNDEPPPAPEISIENSTVCSDFDPDVSLQVGFVDNNGVQVGPYSATASDYTEVTTGDNRRANDGIDVGWVTTSDVSMTVKHHFDGVARGQNFNVTGVEASKGTSKALTMTNRVGNTVARSTIDDNDFKGALLVGALAQAESSDGAGDGIVASSACATDPYTNPIAGLHKPDSCFRVVTAGDTKTGIDYYGGYSIELAAKDSGVSWGKVAWDPDPFKDLKCESMTFTATDVAEEDVCELFGEEVDRAIEKMWGGEDGDTVTFLTGPATTSRPARYDTPLADPPTNNTNYAALSTTNTNHLVALQIEAPAAESRRFASLWYNDNDKRVDSKDKSNHNLYAAAAAPLHIELLDEDGDPKYGDFGKVDFVKPDGTDAGLTRDFGEDGVAETAPGGESKCTHSDGENCDGMLEETITVKFDAGLALGCSTTRDVMITCEWDANGEMGRYRADDHHNISAGTPLVTPGLDDDPAQSGDQSTASSFGGFRTSETGRTAGDIAAFVKCSVTSE